MGSLQNQGNFNKLKIILRSALSISRGEKFEFIDPEKLSDRIFNQIIVCFDENMISEEEQLEIIPFLRKLLESTKTDFYHDVKADYTRDKYFTEGSTKVEFQVYMSKVEELELWKGSFNISFNEYIEKLNFTMDLIDSRLNSLYTDLSEKIGIGNDECSDELNSKSGFDKITLVDKMWFLDKIGIIKLIKSNYKNVGENDYHLADLLCFIMNNPEQYNTVRKNLTDFRNRTDTFDTEKRQDVMKFLSSKYRLS
jgi:hypothetical protein